MTDSEGDLSAAVPGTVSDHPIGVGSSPLDERRQLVAIASVRTGRRWAAEQIVRDAVVASAGALDGSEVRAAVLRRCTPLRALAAATRARIKLAGWRGLVPPSSSNASEEFWEAVRRVGSAEADAFVLRHVGGLELHQIAVTLGSGVEEAEVLVRTATKRLRQRFDPDAAIEIELVSEQ